MLKVVKPRPVKTPKYGPDLFDPLITLFGGVAHPGWHPQAVGADIDSVDADGIIDWLIVKVRVVGV